MRSLPFQSPPYARDFTCFQNQFTNGLYVLEDNSSTTHIFDFESQTWSAQQATGGPSGDFVAILDHE
jgi:hypothetical protein